MRSRKPNKSKTQKRMSQTSSSAPHTCHRLRSQPSRTQSFSKRSPGGPIPPVSKLLRRCALLYVLNPDLQCLDVREDRCLPLIQESSLAKCIYWPLGSTAEKFLLPSISHVVLYWCLSSSAVLRSLHNRKRSNGATAHKVQTGKESASIYIHLYGTTAPPRPLSRHTAL